MKNNEVMRRATKADYDDIISIISSGEYDGDYLPDYFHILMDNPLYDAFVYILNDKIIAISAIFIIDNGMTGAIRNARVRKEYRGKGIVRKLNDELIKHHPTIKYSSFVTVTHLSTAYRKINLGVYKLITIQKGTFYSGKKQGLNMSRLQKDGRWTTTQLLNENDLRQMIREQDAYPSIFKDGRLVIDSVSYRIMESNVPIILMERTRAVASFMDNKKETLLTFGSYFRQPNGEMFCTVNVYGIIGKTFPSHILLHIQAFMELIRDEFTIEVRYKEYSDIIEQSMNELGLSNASVGTTRRTDILSLEEVLLPESKL